MTIQDHFLAVIRIVAVMIGRLAGTEERSGPGQGRSEWGRMGDPGPPLNPSQEEANYHDLLILIGSAASPAIK
jgi:hypothetical protein